MCTHMFKILNISRASPAVGEPEGPAGPSNIRKRPTIPTSHICTPIFFANYALNLCESTGSYQFRPLRINGESLGTTLVIVRSGFVDFVIFGRLLLMII